jgi:hypothetical protein
VVLAVSICMVSVRFNPNIIMVKNRVILQNAMHQNPASVLIK